MKKYIFLCSIAIGFMATSCGKTGPDPDAEIKEQPQIEDSSEQQASAPLPTPTDEEKKIIDTEIPPIDEVPVPYPPGPLDSLYGVPLYGGGGGGGGGSSGGGGQPAALPCEGGTSDCNDKNPCTLDSCVNDLCVHEFDNLKTDLGGCEVDGKACTVGKCVNANNVISCHEEPREFLAGDLSCADSNTCTADSCIESAPTSDGPTAMDDEGNAILVTEAVCVHESLAGMPCIFEEECSPGICVVTGTGMPADEFAIACAEDTESLAPVVCPDEDNNPCTTESCVVGQGCVSTPLAPDTTCNDFDPCTMNDACQTDPNTSAFYCFGTPRVVVAEVDGGFDDGNICTDDSCSEGVAIHTGLDGPFGSSCETTFPGVCAEGVLQCSEGVEVSDMCIALFRPGDKEEVCPNSLDDDCDGEVDNCPPPPNLVAFVTSTTYVGGFGGRAGADIACNDQASAGSLPGTFVAWMADGTGPGNGEATSSGRVEDEGLGYVLTNGTVIATSHTELTNGALDAAIDRDENGVQVVGAPLLAWTGANDDGSFSGQDCDTWSMTTGSGTTGDIQATGTTWSNDGASACDELRRLYCFQILP